MPQKISDNLSRAEQSRAEQSRAEQSRAEQSRAEQSRAEPSLKSKKAQAAKAPANSAASVFKNLDKILREAGVATALGYAAQKSWLLFLKYLEDLETRRQDEAALEGKTYECLLSEEYRWSSWARNEDLTGPDLLDFVRTDLFPYLRDLGKAETEKNLKTLISNIFSEGGGIHCDFNDGFHLKNALDKIDALTFKTDKDRHQLSDVYEETIRQLGNAGRNGGEYYTPRPLIRAMIAVVKPQIGEVIYDGACGSAGFLCEAFEHLNRRDLTPDEYRFLHSKALKGGEWKALPYCLAVMNLILHGVENPDVTLGDTLSQNVQDILAKDRVDIVLANPPFGAVSSLANRKNFPIETGESAYLFLQHFIRKLKKGGRAAIVIKNTFLSNNDNASQVLRRELLRQCNLEIVLNMPAKTFAGAGVGTVVLFFTKGEATKKIWYYECDPGRSLGKTNPLNDKDLAEFVALSETKPETEKSWNLSVKEMLAQENAEIDLSVRNPNAPKEAPKRDPQEILKEISKNHEALSQIWQKLERLA